MHPNINKPILLKSVILFIKLWTETGVCVCQCQKVSNGTEVLGIPFSHNHAHLGPILYSQSLNEGHVLNIYGVWVWIWCKTNVVSTERLLLNFYHVIGSGSNHLDLFSC